MKRLAIVLLLACVAGIAGAKDEPIPELIQANAEQYKALKKRLGVTDKELSRVDVLELVALSYAGMLDQLNNKAADLERRVASLEVKTKDLRTDTDDLKDSSKKMQEQIKEIDADLTKLFDAHNKLNDQVNNGLDSNSIVSKLGQLRNDVANDLDSHAKSIEAAQRGVNNNASAIQGLYNEIRSLRFR